MEKEYISLLTGVETTLIYMQKIMHFFHLFSLIKV